MAHWAEIDENNKVIQVTLGNNDEPDEGYQWLVDNFGGTWVKTSINTKHGKHILGGTPLRKNFAGIGFTYDKPRDAFIPPKPFESWRLNESTCDWEAPVKKPTDKMTDWNEETGEWVDYPKPFESWVYDDVKQHWKPIVPRPSDGKNYEWDEATISWKEII